AMASAWGRGKRDPVLLIILSNFTQYDECRKESIRRPVLAVGRSERGTRSRRASKSGQVTCVAGNDTSFVHVAINRPFNSGPGESTRHSLVPNPLPVAVLRLSAPLRSLMPTAAISS